MIRIPEEYKENEKRGKCRVCGKAVQRPFRKYCSGKCSLKYQECFKSWASYKKEVIAERGHKCEKCLDEKKDLEFDHITAIINGGDMWDKTNLQLLCRQCHAKKTVADMRRRNAGGANQLLLQT